MRGSPSAAGEVNRLLEHLEKMMDESGTCRLTGGYAHMLALELDVSENTIRNHLSLLTTLKLIKKEKKRERGTVGPVTFFSFTLVRPGARVERVDGFYQTVTP